MILIELVMYFVLSLSLLFLLEEVVSQSWSTRYDERGCAFRTQQERKLVHCPMLLYSDNCLAEHVAYR